MVHWFKNAHFSNSLRSIALQSKNILIVLHYCDKYSWPLHNVFGSKQLLWVQRRAKQMTPRYYEQYCYLLLCVFVWNVKMCVLMLTKILSLLLIWHQVNKGPVSPIPILLTTLKAPYLCHFPYNNNNSVVYTLNLEDSSLFAYQMTVANASA